MRLLGVLLCALQAGCYSGYLAWYFGAPESCEVSGACPEIEWVALPAGRFVMGDDNFRERYLASMGLWQPGSHPEREVTLGAFEIMKTEVTVAQYRACMAAGACFEVQSGTYDYSGEACDGHATWARSDEASANLPVNCLRRSDMERFAAWVGGRLPTEAEWEYAATNAGQAEVTYPWGTEQVSCAYAVIHEAEGAGCGGPIPAPVCSKSRGHSAQGLCDLVGNLAEMVLDDATVDYSQAPADGTADLSGPAERVVLGQDRVTRGGSFQSSLVYYDETEPTALEVRRRHLGHENARWAVGFRLVREVQP